MSLSSTSQLSHKNARRATSISLLVTPGRFGRTTYKTFPTIVHQLTHGESSTLHSAKGLENTDPPKGCRHLHEQNNLDISWMNADAISPTNWYQAEGSFNRCSKECRFRLYLCSCAMFTISSHSCHSGDLHRVPSRWGKFPWNHGDGGRLLFAERSHSYASIKY